MPKPKKDEDKDEYIERAMKQMIGKEHMEPKKALGKAYGIFKHSKKKK